MNLKLTQPELFTASRPRQIVTDTPEDFFRVCDRADAGEFAIEALSVGKTNSQWVFSVRWK